jgi:ferredoxin-type protein NapF
MTKINTARRAFLRGNSVSVAHHVPWAVEAFEGMCRRCDDCIHACEEAILTIGDGGFPTVDFARGSCTFCGACAAACRYGALDRAVSPAWQIRPTVGGDCLSRRGVTCRSCGDACESRAISFQLALGGRALPQVDPVTCNGCGACVAVCPTQAVQIEEAA